MKTSAVLAALLLTAGCYQNEPNNPRYKITLYYGTGQARSWIACKHIPNGARVDFIDEATRTWVTIAGTFVVERCAE